MHYHDVGLEEKCMGSMYQPTKEGTVAHQENEYLMAIYHYRLPWDMIVYTPLYKKTEDGDG